MELIVLLCAVSLLQLCEAQGPSAVTPVFVQKGDDVLLDVMKANVPKEFIFVRWNFNKLFNKTFILATFFPNKEPAVPSVYTGRIEFPVKNYSVTLKNLQEADSGIYNARLFGAEEERILAAYKVIVQDPVSPVKMTVDSSFSRSSDSCNLTVTCTTQDSHINSTFRCVNKTCSQEGGEQSKVTISGASLHVYLDNGSIICNHSNQVSWTEDIEKIEGFCSLHPVPIESDNSLIVTVLVAVGSIIFLISIITASAVCYHRKTGKYKRESIENTVYELPQAGTTAQPPDQSPTDDASGLSPTSTYCLVGHHTGPVGSTESRSTALPESLYAQVEKPDKSLKN